MERVLGHVDVDEMYLDVDPENLPDKGEIVETTHFFVGQASMSSKKNPATW